MNAKGKKFLSLFLVFSLMMLSINLHAKERRGAELIVMKKDGAKIEGELITVKRDSLLVLTRWTGRDVSIDIADIEVITIVKKSKAGKGALFGALAGVSGSVLAAVLIGDVVEDKGFLDWTIIVGLFSVPGGALIGAIACEIAGTDKTIQIEGMTNSEIRVALDKLGKKARVQNYK